MKCKTSLVERPVLVLLLTFLLFPLLSSTLAAQETLGVKPTGRTGETHLPTLEEKPKGQAPELVLPPVPPKEREEKGRPVVKVFVRKIVITGNTVFSAEELAKITQPYVNRELTSEDLEALRQAITVHYIKKGYVNSGAIIPDQKIVNGVITLRVIEGKVTQIDVEGNKWFTDGYLQSRLALGTGPPVNIAPLQQRLQLLQQNELLERLHAELKPGIQPGESLLKVKVEERQPVKVEAGFETIGRQIDSVHLRAALQETMRLASEVNKYLDETAPWFEIKEDKTILTEKQIYNDAQLKSGIDILRALIITAQPKQEKKQ
jgi:hemolysin activation/secretion protein